MEEPKDNNIGLKQLRDMREETTKRWEKLGLLEGLEGNVVNENCAKLFEGKLSWHFMEHLFVPFELCLILRDKGFDEPCRDHWERGQNDKEWELFTSGEWLTKKDLINDYKDADGNLCGEISAPLYQQVIDWLREKHNLNIIIVGAKYESFEDGYKGGYTWCIADNDTKQVRQALWSPAISTYYGALQKGIEEALNHINHESIANQIQSVG